MALHLIMPRPRCTVWLMNAARCGAPRFYDAIFIYIPRIYSGYINIAAAISIYAEPRAARRHFRSASWLYCSEIWLVGDTYDVAVDLVAFQRVRSNTVLRIELTRNAIVPPKHNNRYSTEKSISFLFKSHRTLSPADHTESSSYAMWLCNILYIQIYREYI